MKGYLTAFTDASVVTTKEYIKGQLVQFPLSQARDPRGIFFFAFILQHIIFLLQAPLFAIAGGNTACTMNSSTTNDNINACILTFINIALCMILLVAVHQSVSEVDYLTPQVAVALQRRARRGYGGGEAGADTIIML